MLQHRGQDAAGVVTCGSGGRFYQVKANGMVRDVFDTKGIQGLKGWMGVGHGMFQAVTIDVLPPLLKMMGL